MNNNLIKVLKYLIGWPLSVISLFFIIKLIFENANSLNNLTNTNLPLLLIGVLFFLSYFSLRAILWSEIIKPKDNKLNFIKTAYYWEISEIKRYTPGNIWSFLSRADLFSKENISKKDIATSLIDEIVLIVISCFAISYFYISSHCLWIEFTIIIK